MRIFFFHLKLGKGIVVLLLGSVPDRRIDFTIVERMRKFNCSSPFTFFFLIAVEQSDLLSKVKKLMFSKHGFASVT